MDSNKKHSKEKEARKEEAKKVQDMDCRFYQNKLPKPNDLVMVKINFYY